MRPDALAAEIAAAARARASIRSRWSRPPAPRPTGAFDPLEDDRRHLRRRGAVAARRCRARRLGRAEPGARSPAGRHRPRRLGRVGPPQDAAVPRALPRCSRTRARGMPTARSPRRPSTSSAAATRAPRTWARARSSARDRSSRWSPTSASRPWAPTACGRTSSGSGSWAASSRRSSARATTSSSRLSPSATSSASATAARRVRIPTRTRSASAPRSTHSGEFYVVQTRLRGATWLRCALMNAATEPADLLAMLAALRAAAASGGV